MVAMKGTICGDSGTHFVENKRRCGRCDSVFVSKDESPSSGQEKGRVDVLGVDAEAPRKNKFRPVWIEGIIWNISLWKALLAISRVENRFIMQLFPLRFGKKKKKTDRF